MKSTKHYCIKMLSITFVFIVSYCLNEAQAQEMKAALCKKFLEEDELYILNTNANTTGLTTSKGIAITFEKLVQENWHRKKIIKIDSKEYDRLKDVKNKFHISIMMFIVSKDYVEQGAIDGIIIQQGKTGRNPTKTLYWVNINFKEISEGILAERLIYAVQNLKDLLNNYDDKSVRDKYLYKTEGYKDYLKSNTLYIRKSNLKSKLQTTGAVKELYPYDFKIVSQEEWAEAIKETKENVLFIEFIRGGKYSAIDIYKAKGGKLIISSYPWIGSNYSIDKTFFKKMFK